MSIFSKACEYAIKSCIFIAQQSLSNRVTSVKQVSEAIDAPLPFTAKILQQMVKAEILQSLRGKQGGFIIVEEKINTKKIIDIVKIIDGEDIFTNCGLGLKKCSDANPCPVHNDYKPIRNGLLKLVNDFSLYDLAHKADLGLAWLK